MSDNNYIQEELKELGSPLEDISHGMPYTVPDGYFQQFPAAIESMAIGNLQPPVLSKELPYSVPVGYFQELPAQLLAAIKDTEPQKGKQIALRPRSQWLTAAMLAFIISVGAYVTFSARAYSTPEQMLASVGKADIKNYVQIRYGMDVNNLLADSKLSELDVENKDIIAYLNDTGWE